MGWMEAIAAAIQYVEDHITDELTVDMVADHVNISSFYFQKGFAMLCGFTISEYIRNRRLALAGNDLATGDERIIDIAMKYGYDSPDSFARAFSRFHGVTPTAARKDRVMLKSFAPLKIKLTLEGGYLMDYRIEKKEAFTVIANAKVFPYDGAKESVPQFWQEHYQTGKGKTVMGEYGINIDEKMGNDTFEYLIADSYTEGKKVPEGFVTRTIPELTWAVFPSVGAMPDALQDVNTKIFTEWLPALKEYEFAAGYCVEMYDDPTKYPKGTQDEKYYCEIWIPVKQK
ncbi:AraC family transcriptional regulator [Frisingicoccus sp.]|uniref:AraC family transcriptional regulator n=1 Tax=Frisingicoccus sp. TaxID=1918627 RepID=UPI002E794FF6|nr:AraC family transcriptional regulator [Frisingicoccus sp.]MEE0751234.1 AraC family transcriptional regulator [Frisingicoccus sp.]